MTEKIEKAFILAAGKGTRMRPLTDTCPKPLLSVAGKPIIDYALDALVSAGVKEVVVNLNYLGHMLENHLANPSDIKITLSWEDELLETGGGVKKELSFFNDQPFYVLNGDVIWTGGTTSVLDRLSAGWDTDKMDLMLLMYPTGKLKDYDGLGDYHLDEVTGKLKYRADGETAPFIFAGPRIVHPRLFNNGPDGAFSFLKLFHKAEAEGKLFGCVHDGEWHHVGTPDALQETDALLRQKQNAA